MSTVWLNGQFIDEDHASVSLRDTGLLHAAGVFTTMRSYAGTVFRIDQHLARLRKSCESLFVPLPYKDEALTAAATELLARDTIPDARLRLTVTRGTTHQDPLHGLHVEPTVFITAAALEPYPPEYYKRGMTVILLDEQKLNPYDIQAGHKTLNYFSRFSGLKSAAKQSAGEALWFNVHNYLQSGSVSNVFVVKGGKLITPPTPTDLQDPTIAARIAYPRSNVLAGIARQTVLDSARENGIETVLASIDVNELLDVDEIFLTNSIMQVMPVCRIERKVIGDDRPGAVTQRLMKAYDDRVNVKPS